MDLKAAPSEKSAVTAGEGAGARRPLKSRDSRWAAGAAAWLARRGVSPNAISLGSVGFAAVGGACYAIVGLLAPQSWVTALLLVLAATCVQGRLLCNLFDGMVAVEHARASKAGEIYNDLPDRFADAIFLAAAGYAAGGAWGPPLGWAAAVAAILTAYVRVLGKSVGGETRFIGPMAKQHRMALLTAASLVAAALVRWDGHRPVLLGALAVMIAGCAVTIIRRLGRIVDDLERGRA